MTETKRYNKPVALPNKDYAEVEKAKESWTKQHGIILSMPQFVMFLLDSYKKKEQL